MIAGKSCESFRCKLQSREILNAVTATSANNPAAIVTGSSDLLGHPVYLALSNLGGSSWILVARVRFDFGLSTSEQGGGFLQASAPASNDLAADVETWYSRKCREKPTQALRGRKLGRDIPVDSAPMVRAVSTSLCSPKLPFKRPLDAGVHA